jgi:putative ABC transport system permease protein
MKRVFRLPGTRRGLDQAVDDELHFHLEGRIEELMEREHLPREEAEREARRRFGDYDTYRRLARDIDERTVRGRARMAFVDTLRRETTHAARALRRSPSFSFIAVLTLALGLAAATTIFTLLERVVLQPLPYPHAERLIHIGTLWPKVKAGEEYALSKGQYFFFRRNSRTLDDLLMYDMDMLAIPGDGEHPAERVRELDVSANTFPLLGIAPYLGRLIRPDEELNPDGDPRAAVLSYGYWQRRFGADRSIIGKRLPIGGDRSLEIVGVLPVGASLPDADADIWIRNHLDPNEPPQNNHTHHAIGVLKPGVSLEAAAADLKRVQQLMKQTYPSVYSDGFIQATGFALNATTLRDRIVGPSIARALWLLFGAVGVVLLIAAANVANLFLVRIDARRREMAVRTALGAGRGELAVHYLTESMLLAIVSAVGAIALAAGLLHVVLSIAPQSLPRVTEVRLDGRSVAFCALGALLFGVVFGLLPLASTNVDVAALREGARGLSASRSRDLARRGLVLSQVALAVVLLAAGGLMTRSFARLRDVRPGFDPTGVVTMTVSLPYTRYADNAAIVAFWRELITRSETVPGVVRAGAAEELPLTDVGGCSYLVTDATGEGEHGNCMPMTGYAPGYFEAMGIAVRGAPATWSSIEAGEAPAYVTSAFAKRFWHDENVIGRHVTPFNPANPPFVIRGIIPEIRSNGLQNPPVEEAYFALLGPPGTKGWRPSRVMHLIVRAPTLSSSAVVSSVRAILSQTDAQVPISDVMTMETVVAKSLAQTSFTMLLLLIAAAIALALSAVGIYGVISYVVGQRRGEIGIRIALGAQVSEVVRLVVGHSVRLTLLGALLGVVIASFATRFLRSLLFEVSPADPLVLAGTVALLLIVATLASFGPTRRASKIDPVEAMRV